MTAGVPVDVMVVAMVAVMAQQPHHCHHASDVSLLNLVELFAGAVGFTHDYVGEDAPISAACHTHPVS